MPAGERKKRERERQVQEQKGRKMNDDSHEGLWSFEEQKAELGERSLKLLLLACQSWHGMCARQVAYSRSEYFGGCCSLPTVKGLEVTSIQRSRGHFLAFSTSMVGGRSELLLCQCALMIEGPAHGQTDWLHDCFATI